MKNQDLRVTKITWRDPKSTMSPEEYSIWKANWDRFWNKLMGEALQQVEEDRKKGIKSKQTPKCELVKRSFEMAEQLDIKLPKSLERLYYDDVYLIEGQLEYELMLKDREKEGCKIVFEPPRLPSSNIIARMVERAMIHKAKQLSWLFPKARANFWLQHNSRVCYS
jgi:hypothetical protein